MEDHGTDSQDRAILPKRFSLTEWGKLATRRETKSVSWFIAATMAYLTFLTPVSHSRYMLSTFWPQTTIGYHLSAQSEFDSRRGDCLRPRLFHTRGRYHLCGGRLLELTL